MKVIKCPNYTPSGDINRFPNPDLRNNPTTNASPKGTNRGFTLIYRLNKYSLERISSYVHFWT